MIDRVAKGDILYPAKVNRVAVHLDAFPDILPPRIIEEYTSRELEHTTHYLERVHCKCERFIGVKLAPSTVASATTIGECLSCDGAACMICLTQLDEEEKVSKALDRGCKEKLEALEKQRLDFIDGTDRGKSYQICPFCKRIGYLPEACHHIYCECGEEFCYVCGKAASDITYNGHWGKQEGQCLQYPERPRVAVVARQAAGRWNEQLQEAARQEAARLDDQFLWALAGRFQNFPVWGELILPRRAARLREFQLAQRANAPMAPAAPNPLHELRVNLEERLQALEIQVEFLAGHQQPVEVDVADLQEEVDEGAAAPEMPAAPEDHEDLNGEAVHLQQAAPQQQAVPALNLDGHYYIDRHGQRIYGQRPVVLADDDREDDFRNEG
jgi:hypothetical protein